MKHMEQQFMEDISLDTLAELTRTNKYHLSKEFKRYTGFSPHDYLIWLRINQAKILLKTTNLPADIGAGAAQIGAVGGKHRLQLILR